MTACPEAPVAQGIEHRPPEAGAQVRILPGARSWDQPKRSATRTNQFRFPPSGVRRCTAGTGALRPSLPNGRPTIRRQTGPVQELLRRVPASRPLPCRGTSRRSSAGCPRSDPAHSATSVGGIPAFSQAAANGAWRAFSYGRWPTDLPAGFLPLSAWARYRLPDVPGRGGTPVCSELKNLWPP